MDTRTDVIEIVRAFLAEDVLSPEEAAALDPEADLLGTGILNSLTLAHLVVFLEESFGFAVEPVDFQLETFQSLAAIRRYVERVAQAMR